MVEGSGDIVIRDRLEPHLGSLDPRAAKWEPADSRVERFLKTNLSLRQVVRNCFRTPIPISKTNLHILRTKKNLKKSKYYFENSLLLFFDVQ